MARSVVRTLLENLDRRVGVIEQKLPTLATKDDLKGLATKEELQSLATKEELRGLATKEEVRSLAMKDEIRNLAAQMATKDDLREFGTQLRLEMKILFEEQWEKIKGLFDAYRHHDEKLDRQAARLDGHDRAINGLDLRVTALESGKSRL